MNKTHPEKRKKMERVNLTEPMDIVLFQIKAIYKINYESF
jgi:hypothetical protein